MGGQKLCSRVSILSRCGETLKLKTIISLSDEITMQIAAIFVDGENNYVKL